MQFNFNDKVNNYYGKHNKLESEDKYNKKKVDRPSDI